MDALNLLRETVLLYGKLGGTAKDASIRPNVLGWIDAFCIFKLSKRRFSK